jgi:hypothetical protein
VVRSYFLHFASNVHGLEVVEGIERPFSKAYMPELEVAAKIGCCGEYVKHRGGTASRYDAIRLSPG